MKKILFLFVLLPLVSFTAHKYYLSLTQIEFNKEAQAIEAELKSTLQLEIPEDNEFWIRDKEVWAFPKRMKPLIGEMRYHRIGFKLAETHKKGYRWQHEAIMALATADNPTCAELNTEQAREWYMGRDVRPDFSGKGETIVTYKGAVIGLGKWVGNRIKNGLPRELVRDGNLF